MLKVQDFSFFFFKIVAGTHLPNLSGCPIVCFLSILVHHFDPGRSCQDRNMYGLGWKGEGRRGGG